MYFQNIIDEALIEQEHTKSKKFVPSLFGACFRRQYYNRKAIPPSNPFDQRTLRVFKCGNIFEQFALDLFCTKHPEAQRQVKIETDDVLGFADAIFIDEVIDIKSQHSKSFWYMNDTTKDIRQEKYNNWMQIAYYAWKLNKPKFRLVFISKDDLCIAEFVQDFEDGYWLGELAKELTALSNFWAKEVTPPISPRLYPQKDGSFKECGYCLWKDYCKKEA